MGRNRRYGSGVSDDLINEVATRPKPISLSERELGKTPLRPADEPIPARPGFPEMPIRATGRAAAWTDKAIWAEFKVKRSEPPSLGVGVRGRSPLGAMHAARAC